MKKICAVIALTLALALPSLTDRAAAQSAGAFVNVVELDINAADRDAFLVAVVLCRFAGPALCPWRV
jgi:hypothetical protein